MQHARIMAPGIQTMTASTLAVSASAPATMLQPSAIEDQDAVMLTQTQQVPFVAIRTDQGVHARFLGLTEPGFTFDWKKDLREVRIGRNPLCEIRVVDDKRVSGFHLRIYRDDAFRYFVEELSSNGCYINNHYMKKGETKSLQHGDEISIGVFVCEHTKKMTSNIASYVFKVADNCSDPDRLANDAPIAVDSNAKESREAASSTSSTDVQLAGRGKSHYVTEQWVRDHWDTRTELGRGNFSTVCLGVHVQGGDKRAVKIIDKKKFLAFQNKRESHLSLSSEADVLVSLSHAGIVGFIEWFETDTHLYLIMELLEGGDLLQCILEHGCFTEATARRVFRELCEAVRYLHTNNVVHRDLKPENLLLTTRDRDHMHLKIADFGLARKTMKSRDCRTFCGTPHYFAPEVIHTFRDKETPAAGYDKQADMWSLGVILYIMLSGMPPFEEDGLYEQILEGKYEFDVREWTTVSPEAKQLVQGLMTVKPKDRLTIEQALNHKWFRFAMPGSCASPARRPPPAFSETVAPMQLSQGEPCSKRRRTSDDAAMDEAQKFEETESVKKEQLGA
jgi:serine/threonine protein kinase